jgi:hypothetical protein
MRHSAGVGWTTGLAASLGAVADFTAAIASAGVVSNHSFRTYDRASRRQLRLRPGCITRSRKHRAGTEAALPTITDLTDHLISSSGLDGPRVRACGRYLREAGILPVSTKRHIPQVEAVHAAVLVIACMAHEHQLHAVQALRDMWNLPHYVADPTELLAAQNDSPPWASTFGQAVTAIIDAYARGSAIEQDNLSEIRIRQGFASAEVIQAGRYQFYREPDPRLRSRPRADHFRTVAEIPFLGLSWLGELVATSRSQAAKLGLEIETASTLRALEPPQSAPPTPGLKPGEDASARISASPSSPDAPSANPDTKTATPGPARDTNAAALSDQPAQTELAGPQQNHPMEGRENSQSSSESRGDRLRNFHRRVILMTDTALVALTALPRELAALTGGDVPSYRKLWTMVVDGRLPALQTNNGRYQVARSDLPNICASLGLRLKEAAPAPRSRKAAVGSSELVAA